MTIFLTMLILGVYTPINEFVLLICFVVLWYNSNKKGVATILNFNYKKFALNIYLYFLYLFNFTYKWLLIIVSILNKQRFLKWKPLFKKSSYFGLYRSARNQWLNK